MELSEKRYAQIMELLVEIDRELRGKNRSGRIGNLARRSRLLLTKSRRMAK